MSVAAQVILTGMPDPEDLRRAQVNDQIVVTVGARVMCEPVGSPRLRMAIRHVDYDEAPVAAWLTELLEGQRRPVWIQRPPAAASAIRATRAARAASTFAGFDVERVLTRAEIDDPMEDMRGHELLQQLKISAVMARAEGLVHPTDEHWEAAGAV